MKRLLTATGILLAATTAQAQQMELEAWSVTCNDTRLLVGEPDNNPVIKVEINYDRDAHRWQVFHHMLSGQIISRSAQYAMTDWSTPSSFRWVGTQFRHRNLKMIGEVRFGRNGRIKYSEWLTDRNQGDQITMHAVATDCEFFD